MYSYVVRDDRSSVYKALIQEISERKNWHCKRGDTVQANLIIGERNTLKFPFGRLGHDGVLQLVNCYRGSGKLSRKTALVTTLTHWKDMTNEDIHAWLPESYVIRPRQLNSTDRNFSETMKMKQRCMAQKPDQRDEFRKGYSMRKERGDGVVWIAKSSVGLKGEGIIISSDPEELISFIDKTSHAHVIQKYIENPLLLPGNRKFDIRCWVLVDHLYNIYLMKEGVLRTCAEPYQSHDLTNFVCHLTNHCIQEAHSKDFGKFEEGNEMFFAEFKRVLQEQWDVSLEDKIISQIKHIVKTCCDSVKEELSTLDLSYHSFQLFGFDFMVDTDMKVWLLEVNSAPACAEKLLPQLIAGLLAVAIDPVFPPSDGEMIDTETGTRVFQKL